LIESTGAVNEDTCINRKKHWPKGGSQIYCFYAVPKGQKPTGENATSNWFLRLYRGVRGKKKSSDQEYN
jgi:hypothetical protein